MRERIGWTLRTSGSLMVPAAAAFVVLGIPIAVLLFAHGSVTPEAARLLGLTLSGMAVGLPAFSAYYVLMRGFYALEDTRTPTYNAMVLNGSNIVLAVAAVAWVPADIAIPALGLAYAVSYWIGLATLAPQLRRRLGGLDGYRVIRTYIRVLLASVLAVVGMVLGVVPAEAMVGRAVDLTSSIVIVSCGLAGGAVGFLLGVRLFRITEVSDVLQLVTGRRPA
jgi:putative peptidoglycan lipid II flippase